MNGEKVSDAEVYRATQATLIELHTRFEIVVQILKDCVDRAKFLEHGMEPEFRMVHEVSHFERRIQEFSNALYDKIHINDEEVLGNMHE